MTLADEMQSVGWSALAGFNARTLTVMGPGGGAVLGLLQTAPPVDPGMELSNDLRELSILEVQGTIPDSITDGTQLRDDSNGAVWKCVKREQNPADFCSKLWVCKVTPEDTQA